MGLKFKAAVKKLKSIITGANGNDANVNASNELQVRDDDVNTKLTTIDNKLVDGNDIGDVTVNNGSGSNAVNIQDGGNSITVDATDLDIRALTHVSDSVKIGDGTDIADVIETNGNKGLVTISPGHISTDNSTIETLGNSGVFTGAWENIVNFGIISVTINVTEDSIVNGLCIDFSFDGISVDGNDYFTLVGGESKTFSFQAATKYFRIKYTNGTTPSDIRLQTKLSPYYIKPSSHRISDTISPEDDAELMKAVLTGENPSGDFINFSATNGGNFKMSLEELENDISVNSNTQLKTTQHDISGNPIDSHLGADGGYHMGTAMIQAIFTSTNNSTTTNLAAGATFTGTSEETLGINGIQTYHFADQDCIIYIEQSLDNINWDVSDSFPCLANNACTKTVKSDAPYFRIRITNTGLVATTVIRFGSGMAPFVNPLPRALTEDDRLKVETTLTSNQGLSRHADITPTQSLSTITPVRLAGTNFDGTNKDTNFWTEVVANGGTVTQDGEIELKTNTTADGAASYQTVNRARFVVGSALRFVAIAKSETPTVTDNVRRLGAYDTTDGFFFQLADGVFSVVTRHSSTDTVVSSGSFNGNYGPTLVIDDEYHKAEIEWTPNGVFFYVDNKLLHKITGGHLSGYLSLPGKFENYNINGSTTNVVFDMLGLAISRLGELTTESTSKYIGTNTTTICKYGAGVLHAVINCDNSGNIIIYDNIAASGTIIASIDTAKVLGDLQFDSPFSTGLTIVTNLGAKVTITYE